MGQPHVNQRDVDTHAAHLALAPIAQQACDLLDTRVGKGRYQLLVVVHAGGRVQYAGTRERASSARMLRDLLNVWRAGIPDVDPDARRWAVDSPVHLLLEQLHDAYGSGEPDMVATRRQAIVDFFATLAQPAGSAS